MKKLLLLIIMLPTLMYGQLSEIGWMGIHKNTIELDKQLHFTGAGAIGTMTYMVTYAATDGNRKKAKALGIALPTAIFLGKEIFDTNKTGFDLKDLGYSVAGTVVFVYSYDFITRRAERRNKKRQEAIAIIDAFYDDNLNDK